MLILITYTYLIHSHLFFIILPFIFNLVCYLIANNQNRKQILVEFDDADWKKREWIRVYEDNRFTVFLIEYTIIWAVGNDTLDGQSKTWLALVS